MCISIKTFSRSQVTFGMKRLKNISMFGNVLTLS